MHELHIWNARNLLSNLNCYYTIHDNAICFIASFKKLVHFSINLPNKIKTTNLQHTERGARARAHARARARVRERERGARAAARRDVD